MKTLRSRQSAFTLIEVLIAMGIFAIGSLGVLAMVTTSMSINSNAKQIQEASLLAQWKLEQIQLIPVAHAFIASCGSGSGCWQNGTSATPATAAAGVQPTNVLGSQAGSTAYYQLNWKSTTLTSPNAGLRYIHVAAYWPRDPKLMSSDYSGTLDCRANPTLCRMVEFHVYK
jgi:prepilin-type N-terminal cleavage/methylation domain-containing protein